MAQAGPTDYSRTDYQCVLDEIARSDELATFMGNAGFNLSREGPDEFAKTLEQQDELFRDILTGPAFRSMSGEHFGPMILYVGQQ